MPRNAVLVIARFWVACFVFALLPFGLPAVLAGVLTLPCVAFVALLVDSTHGSTVLARGRFDPSPSSFP